MAGAYCRFCGHRCFVERVLPDNRRLHMATCSQGMAFDRERTGYDADTAYNPSETRPEFEPRPPQTFSQISDERQWEWNNEIDVLIEFIESKDLYDELTVFARKRADAEIAEEEAADPPILVCSFCDYYARLAHELPTGEAVDPTPAHLQSHPVEAVPIRVENR